MRRQSVWLLVAALAGSMGCRRGAGHDGPSAPLDARHTEAEAPRPVFHFDRNALVASVRSGDLLIALTSSGNLLRFDPATLRMAAERIAPVPISQLVADGGRIYAATREGALGAVDPSTLGLRQEVQLSSEPLWIGFSSRGRLIAVLRNKDSVLVAQDVFAKRSIPIESFGMEGALCFLIDRNERLWIGADAGEWGGGIAVLDLSSGRSHPVPHIARDGVYGFLELPDGRVWAYGGLEHLGSSSTFVSVVTPEAEKPLYGNSSRSSGSVRLGPRGLRDPERPASGPSAPVSRIVLDAPKTVLLLAGATLFQSDLALRRFEPLVSLPARVNPGRPDAVGSYPAISAVHVLGPRDFLFSTVRDGFFRSEAGALSRHTLSGQMDVDSVGWMRPGSGGPVLIGSWRTVHPRLLSGGVWGVPTGQRDDELPEAGFAAPDGQWWRVEGERVERKDGGLWRKAGQADTKVSLTYGVVNGVGPPWILVDRENEKLIRLTPGSAQEAATLTLVAEGVRDAIAWTEGRLLVAGKAGLGILHLATAQLQPQEGPRDLFAVGRDKLGRIWVGGTGLFYAEGNGPPWALQPVPVAEIPEPFVLSVLADPEHDDGVLAALGRRGLLSVRTPLKRAR